MYTDIKFCSVTISIVVLYMYTGNMYRVQTAVEAICIQMSICKDQ